MVPVAAGGLASLISALGGPAYALAWGTLGGGLLSSLFSGRGSSSGSSTQNDYKPGVYTGSDPVFPDDDYLHGKMAEWKYFADGGPVQQPPRQQPPQNNSDAQLIQATVAAMTGQAPNAQQIIAMFVQRFGRNALADLQKRIQGGGAVRGPGTGRSDSVPAMIEGQQPAQLSDGEYVLPADVVSGIGQGSTDAGVRQLEEMIKKVRATNTGRK